MNESNLYPLQSNYKIWKNDNNHDDDDDDNYNAGLTSIDGKCNQLQVDLFSVGTEIDNLKKKIDSLEEDYHNKNVPQPPPLPQRRQQQQRRRRQQQLPPRPQCFVVFCRGFIEIYGYSQSSVGVLIGKKGYNIRRIERLYNIRIEIPSKSSSSSSKNEPIKIFPKSRYCYDLYSLFWGIRCVVNILG